MPNEGELTRTRVAIKVRRPSTVAILSVVTLGIYSTIWYYKVNREIRDFGARHGDRRLAASKPWHSLIAVTIGSVIVIPRLVSLVRTVRRVQTVEQIGTGAARPALGQRVALVSAVLLPLGASIHQLGPLLALAGFTAFVGAITLLQVRLNAVWQATAATVTRTQDSREIVAA